MVGVDKSTKIVRSFLCRSVMMCGAWKCAYSVWKQAKKQNESEVVCNSSISSNGDNRM